MHNLRKAKAHNALIINTLQNEAISPEGGGQSKRPIINGYRSFALQGQMPERHLGYALLRWPPPAIPHPGGQGCRNLCGLPFSGEAAGKVF
jgi:hypothetical protein